MSVDNSNLETLEDYLKYSKPSKMMKSDLLGMVDAHFAVAEKSYQTYKLLCIDDHKVLLDFSGKIKDFEDLTFAENLWMTASKKHDDGITRLHRSMKALLVAYQPNYPDFVIAASRRYIFMYATCPSSEVLFLRRLAGMADIACGYDDEFRKKFRAIMVREIQKRNRDKRYKPMLSIIEQTTADQPPL